MFRSCCSRSCIPNSKLNPVHPEKSLEDTEYLDNLFRNCVLEAENTKNLSNYYSQHIEASIPVETDYQTSDQSDFILSKPQNPPHFPIEKEASAHSSTDCAECSSPSEGFCISCSGVKYCKVCFIRSHRSALGDHRLVRYGVGKV
jgi:hypothetical protein